MTFTEYLALKHNLDLDLELLAYQRAFEITEDKRVLFVDKLYTAAFIKFGYTKKQIQERNRDTELKAVRQVMAYLMVKSNMFALKRIGKELGNYHHSTIIHSRDLVNDFIEIGDKQYINILNQFNSYLNEEMPILQKAV